ncbi:MAG: prepilin-type N-terminal cleavage/methylation domain-containing protein [Blastocatellia bacterium]|nr:prepilin-type N-terminal cleavage/methylation domain-containing protein [Blastocatellia bacterium]
MKRKRPPNRNQRGVTLLELLLAMSVILIVGTAAGAYMLSLNKGTGVAVDSMLLNRTATELASRFADAKQTEPRTGVVVLAKDGLHVDEDPAPAGERLEYETETKVFDNGTASVLVTVRKNRLTVEAGSMFFVPPPTP